MFIATLSTITADLLSVTDYINEGKILFVKSACFIDFVGHCPHIIFQLNIGQRDKILLHVNKKAKRQ